MSNYDNTNRGALFKVSEKKQEKSPDYTGTINVGGTEMKIAGWIRKSKAGATYLSLQVSEQQERQESKPAAKGGFSDMPDDCPF